jgi:hypothetical protein
MNCYPLDSEVWPSIGNICDNSSNNTVVTALTAQEISLKSRVQSQTNLLAISYEHSNTATSFQSILVFTCQYRFIRLQIIICPLLNKSAI